MRLLNQRINYQSFLLNTGDLWSNLRAMEFLKKTLIKEVMAAPAITVNENDDFSKVHEKFQFHDIRHLPVVNANGGIVGLITQRELFKIHSPHKLDDGNWFYDKDLLNGFILKNVMFKDVFTLTPERPLYDAVDFMVRQKVGCVPIVDDYNFVQGVITRDDILKYILTK